MHIRPARISDKDAIEQLYLAAFDQSEAAAVAELALEFLGENSQPACLNLVALVNDNNNDNNHNSEAGEPGGPSIVGHISLSPCFEPGSNKLVAYILAPLAVAPGEQKQGLGSALVKQALVQIKQHCDYILVYGDPAYYGRFGFNTELGQSFIPPYPLQFAEGWQALALKPHASSPEQARKFHCLGPLSHAALW
ncbi:GNAT family N-acetyltransferase [Agaribacterium haliotis]|uniref:GNAT family N-acetyltransferase n=1 Tax=Agaribacterium haliotis TaxID=2013869 RepID=UPI000BB544DA|nr:N-acetyltransferase [Agaribacterium haliotis]